VSGGSAIFNNCFPKFSPANKRASRPRRILKPDYHVLLLLEPVLPQPSREGFDGHWEAVATVENNEALHPGTL
jgi:hypothetical protein